MTWPDLEPVRAVLRGGARANASLADWVAARYDVEVVDVVEDVIQLGPRLVVWVRSPQEAQSFRTASGGYDARKQRAVGDAAGRPGVFVIFCSADQELHDATLAAVGEAACTAVVAAVLDDPGSLWKAYPLFGGLFVFLHTDAQADALRDTPAAERVADALWTAAHARDEFGVVPRDGIRLTVDSKQNLDENFEGSSYYYHR